MKERVFLTPFLILSMVIMICCKGQSVADSSISVRIDSLLNRVYMQNDPGVAVLVSKNDKVLYSGCRGLANIETGQPVNQQTLFAIGSVTKQFTSIAVLMLAEQGKITISDPVEKHLPGLLPYGEEVTIGNLLSHTSGIPDLFDIPEFFSKWNERVTPTQIVDLFREKLLLFKPGTTYHYSNSNYVLLGMIIEKVSGISFNDFIKVHLLAPNDMNQTVVPLHSSEVINLAKGYYETNNGFSPADEIDYSILFGAGSIFSNTVDLIKWYRWLTQEYKDGDRKVMTAISQFEFTDGKHANNGYGMMRLDVDGNVAFGNNGSMVGYNAYTLWIPDQELTVILLTNRFGRNIAGKSASGSDVGTIARLIAQIALGKAFNQKAEPDNPDYITIREDRLENYTGVYLIEDKVYRIITRKGNQLYARRSNSGSKTPIYPVSETLFLNSEGTRYEFVFDNTLLAREANWIREDGTKSVGIRTEIPLPVDKKAVSIPENDLNAVCGQYKMMAVFNVDIYRADSAGIVVDSKQRGKSLFYPESSSRFFLDDDNDVVIDFEINKSGAIEGFIMETRNKTFSAKRVR